MLSAWGMSPPRRRAVQEACRQTSLAGSLGACRGGPQAPPGLPETAPSGSPEGGSPGTPGVEESTTRRQHVAEDGPSRPALLCHWLWARVSPPRASVSWTAKVAHSLATGGTAGETTKALGYGVRCLDQVLQSVQHGPCLPIQKMTPQTGPCHAGGSGGQRRRLERTSPRVSVGNKHSFLTPISVWWYRGSS